jgi:hypothetical protein
MPLKFHKTIGSSRAGEIKTARGFRHPHGFELILGRDLRADCSQFRIAAGRIIRAFDESTHLFGVKYDNLRLGALHHM